MTLSHTQGVVKNIIPAIPSTNAIVAAACALEVVKIVTCCSPGLDNYQMYNGTRGVYTHTVPYAREEECPVCSAGVPLRLPAGATLQAVLDALLARFPTRLSAPSVSCGRTNLYMRGVFEEETRPNLAKPVAELMGASSGLLVVNDKKLHGPLRVRLTCGEAMDESQP